MSYLWKDIQIGYPLYLKNGEIILSDYNTQIITILGSCVSVIMYYPPLKLGSMSHALMPDREESIRDYREKENLNPLNFVHQAILSQYKELLDKNVDTGQLCISLLGGAHYSDQPLSAYHEKSNIGKQNIAVARKTLAALNLKIQMEDVEGENGRKVLFNPSTGQVNVKIISMGKAK